MVDLSLDVVTDTAHLLPAAFHMGDEKYNEFSIMAHTALLGWVVSTCLRRIRIRTIMILLIWPPFHSFPQPFLFLLLWCIETERTINALYRAISCRAGMSVYIRFVVYMIHTRMQTYVEVPTNSLMS